MSAYVYVLGTRAAHGGRTYVGWTLDPQRRLAEHNAGGPKGARSTRGRVWVLLHTEQFDTRTEAMSREWYLKRDRAFRRRLLAGLTAAPSDDGEASGTGPQTDQA